MNQRVVPIESVQPNPANPREQVDPLGKKTYSKIVFADGDWCICLPGDIKDLTVGCGGFTVGEVQLTQAEFEALPDYNG